MMRGRSIAQYLRMIRLFLFTLALSKSYFHSHFKIRNAQLHAWNAVEDDYYFGLQIDECAYHQQAGLAMSSRTDGAVIGHDSTAHAQTT